MKFVFRQNPGSANGIISIMLACMLLSCQPLLRRVVGINDISRFTPEEITELAAKYHVADAELLVLRDTAYLQFMHAYIESRSTGFDSAKFLYQPLQVMGFDSAGRIQFHLVNCNIGGFPNLQWNRYGYFDVAPLHMPGQLLPDSTLEITSFSGLYAPVFPELDGIQPQSGETIIAYWNHFMGRQSKRLIATVHEYKNNTYPNAKIYFVNTDNFIYLLHTDSI